MQLPGGTTPATRGWSRRARTCCRTGPAPRASRAVTAAKSLPAWCRAHRKPGRRRPACSPRWPPLHNGRTSSHGRRVPDLRAASHQPRSRCILRQGCQTHRTVLLSPPELRLGGAPVPRRRMEARVMGTVVGAPQRPHCPGNGRSSRGAGESGKGSTQTSISPGRAWNRPSRCLVNIGQIGSVTE